MNSHALPPMPSRRNQVSEAEWRQRVDLAAAYRLVALFGWDDLVFTHISARVPDSDDQFLIKFHNLWTVQAPPGYSLLFTHPVNRSDLPFTTLTGLVDCDRYHDNWINFPAHWHDADFSGVLPRGTPVAQCYPVKRQTWLARTATFTNAGGRWMPSTIRLA